jgi:hypothetical protein
MLSKWRIWAPPIFGIVAVIVAMVILGLYFMHWSQMLFLFIVIGVNNLLCRAGGKKADASRHHDLAD